MFLSDILEIFSRNKLFNIILLFISSIILGIISLYFASITVGNELFQSYFKTPIIPILNILPCIWLVFLFWFITRRAAVSFAISSLIVFGLSIANFFKLQFRNDAVLFGDLFLIKEATNMSERYKLYITPAMVIALVVIIVIIVLLSFLAHSEVPVTARVIGVISCLVLIIPLKIVYLDDNIYDEKTNNTEYINEWISTEVYISKGFVYPFIHSIKESIKSPPDNYDADKASALISQYEDANIPENEKVDIIGIMLEAYADFSVYDQIEFENDPYEFYHELETESISGNLYTNIFAGGTIDSEHGFVTGYCDQGSFRAKTNSYPWYFRSQGYTVTGSHPSYDWFYNRVNINENLGYESYNFISNYYNQFTDGTTAMDRILMPEIINLHEKHKQESDSPYFSFSVSYQGHGPYGTDQNYYGTDYVKSGIYSEQTENILNNYFGSIADTNVHLEELVNHYKESDDPVILVLFGDHKPWLGDNSSVYTELGIDLNYTDTEGEGFKNYYATRYLIWANDAAKEALDNDFIGHGPDIGPYFLMNLLFRECGWKGPAYMQAIDEVSQQVPVISVSGLYMQDGVLTDELTKENQQLVDNYKFMEYYEQNNFHYNNLK